MISVIIPVYNCKRHIASCVNSVIAQTYKDFEIILIDDASTDGTTDTCQQIANRHSCINYIRNPKNKGLYANRLLGISLANGEYITFIDSDDSIHSRSLASLLEAIERAKADIAQMNLSHFLSISGLRFYRSHVENVLPQIIEGKDIRNNYIQSFLGNDHLIPVNVCGKLYKTSLLKSFLWEAYPEMWGEDRFFNLQVFHHVQRLAITPLCGYFYRWGGMTSSKHLLDDYRQYDSNMELMSALAEKLGYSRHLPLLKKCNHRFFHYHIRNCILSSSVSSSDTIKLIQSHEHITYNQAVKFYNDELHVIYSHLPRYLVRLLIS
ncbi:MAG: glycosyltransferase [Muribaculaceae bacterium]|jgi:glycosyltransferase involved in cell wall biosynthesis|nr:glycosyltransferase [Muribaculaceae bacterium]